MSGMKWWMQKYPIKHENMHYIKKNYVLKLIYNDKCERNNDTSSNDHT